MVSQALGDHVTCLEDERVSRAPFAVLFDSDGVVVDTEGISLTSFRQATREFLGVELSEEEIERACGLRDADIVSRLGRQYSKKIDLEAYRERKAELYRLQASAHPVQAFPGVVELLDHLRHERIPYALASSGARSKIEYNLSSAGLRSHFSVIVSGEEVERGKPEPDVFLEAARRVGVEPARCVVVEDSINGILAGRTGGMAVLAVTNTFAQYLLNQADRVVNTLERLRVADFHDLVLCNQSGGGYQGGAGGGSHPPGAPEETPRPSRSRIGVHSLS